MEGFKKTAVKNVLNGLQVEIHELTRESGEWPELEKFDYSDESERLEAISATDIEEGIELCQEILARALKAQNQKPSKYSKKHPAATELDMELSEAVFQIFDLAEAAGVDLAAGILTIISDYQKETR
jgi:hypothetical protein